jgi:hypothetical protein
MSEFAAAAKCFLYAKYLMTTEERVTCGVRVQETSPVAISVRGKLEQCRELLTLEIHSYGSK